MPLSNGTLPNKANVSKQIMVNQQLAAHYRKLQSAKAAVDTSSPYTFRRNPTTRGYRTQKQSPCSNLNTRLRVDDEQDDSCLPAKFSDDQVVNDIVKEYLKNNPIFIGSGSADIWPGGGENATANLTIGSNRNPRENSRLIRSVTGSSRSMYGTRPTSSHGDVLERHQHKFTKEKPFSPRTVKTNAESKLRRLRCYNPPIRARRSSTEKQPSRPSSAGETLVESGTPHGRPSSVKSQHSTSKSSPRMTARRATSSVRSHSPRGSNLSDHGRSATVRVQSVTRSHDRRDSPSKSRLTEPQPVLGVSVVPRVTNVTPVSTDPVTEQNTPAMGKVDQWLNTLPDSRALTEQSVPTGYIIDASGRSNRMEAAHNRPAGAKMVQDGTSGLANSQDDIGYLNYIEAVTNDVLVRGVYTDRNLNWLLMEHATRNDFGLTQEQLQRATDQLREQLKISDAPSPTAPLRLSSGSWTTAGGSISDGHGMANRTSLSVETNESGFLGSSGTTVSAKLVPTSMRPPPVPGRTNTASIAHRVTGGRASTRAAHLKSSDTDRHMGDETQELIWQEPGSVENRAPSTLSVPQASGAPTTPMENVTPSRIERSTEFTDALAPAINTDENLANMEHEDTLNDQLTIPNLSSSVHCTDASDIPEASPPESQSITPVSDAELDRLNPAQVGGAQQPEQANAPVRNKDGEAATTRHPRVKFAPEPEIMIAKSNDLNTLASSLTDLTQVSSGEAQGSSQPDAEPDLSSVQAIAEGDSNFSFELITPPKDCNPLTPLQDTLSPRAKS